MTDQPFQAMTDPVALDFPRDGVALITMNNPAVNNHGTWAAIGALADALVKARKDGARVSVLASGVSGHWFEHAWLPDLIATFEGTPTTGDGASWWRCLHELTKTNVVTIAAVTGDTSGGGCELGWACDLRIAEQQVLFGQPEVTIGVGTGIGGTSRLRHLIGRTATAEMVLLGSPMTAQRIYELGGVNRIVPTGHGLDVALAWASDLADKPPAALEGMKLMLSEGDDLHISEAVMNDQRIFQTFAGSPNALRSMRSVQESFDAGATIRQTYGEWRP